MNNKYSQKWTLDEEKAIMEAIFYGEPLSTIARRHKRTVEDIKSRALYIAFQCNRSTPLEIIHQRTNIPLDELIRYKQRKIAQHIKRVRREATSYKFDGRQSSAPKPTFIKPRLPIMHDAIFDRQAISDRQAICDNNNPDSVNNQQDMSYLLLVEIRNKLDILVKNQEKELARDQDHCDEMQHNNIDTSDRDDRQAVRPSDLKLYDKLASLSIIDRQPRDKPRDNNIDDIYGLITPQTYTLPALNRLHDSMGSLELANNDVPSCDDIFGKDFNTFRFIDIDSPAKVDTNHITRDSLSRDSLSKDSLPKDSISRDNSSITETDSDDDKWFTQRRRKMPRKYDYSDISMVSSKNKSRVGGQYDSLSSDTSG